MTKPRPIPDGYGTVTPWVVTRDTRRLLEFIKDAFDAEELSRIEVEGGAIGHAEARIGATPVTRLTELAWGDRVGRVRDPLGNIWWIQERLEEPAPDGLARRFQDPKFTEAMRYVQSTLGPGLNAS